MNLTVIFKFRNLNDIFCNSITLLFINLRIFLFRNITFFLFLEIDTHWLPSLSLDKDNTPCNNCICDILNHFQVRYIVFLQGYKRKNMAGLFIGISVALIQKLSSRY